MPPINPSYSSYVYIIWPSGVLGSDGPPRGGALEVPAHLGYGGAAGHRRPPRGGGLRVQRRPQLPADGRGGGGGGALCQTGRMMNSRG
eukprot:8076193-Pyramimonas_sp.AAC.1